MDDFLQQLLSFPPEAEIISESVYANSQTMDGRRFAEEFLRRRKAAASGASGSSNGHVDVGAGSSSSQGQGWSEVAKKGGEKKESSGQEQFKIVAGKRRGKK